MQTARGERLEGGPREGRVLVDFVSPLGPLYFEGAQHRQTLRPSRRRDPQQSTASFRIAVKDLEDPLIDTY